MFFEEDTVENSGKPVVIIKIDTPSKADIRKVKKAALVIYKSFKRFIAYIYIHDMDGEEVALVASDGKWCYV